MNRLRDFLQSRIPVDPDALRALTNEPIPDHMRRWWFCLGGTPAYLFVLQIVTGLLLAVYYEPSSLRAYASVRFIHDDVAFGWYLRGLHRWGATFMVAAVVLHQMRVFFTGAYRRPRELNWLVGCILLGSTLMAGFTGYSLVFEQLSYWGTTVAGNLLGAIPVVGEPLRRALLAGDAYNLHTLPRMFVLHGAVLPTTIAAFVVVHILFVRLHGVAPLSEADSSRRFPLIPDHVLTELAIGLVLMIVLSTLAVAFPPVPGPPADPASTPLVIKPEWYFYPVFRWLKLFSLPVALGSMGFAVVTVVLWPFVDGWIRRRRPGSEASVAIGAAAVLILLALTVWEASVAH
ncbi:MAG: cytochrome bc complex cytochrome b subunit [Deltaproteobacteria bacterium]|nr:MAG: cytochrome bc complex cytochrome b subunit [Deltaproteobacteria bacterium]